MRFEMFTEHEVEIFALRINFFNLNEFFLSICMQHTDKKVPRKWFFGGIFFILCTAGSLELPGALPLVPHQGSALDPLGAYSTPPDPLLLQAMTYGHCASCLQHDTTFIHALTTNLAHHSKFLKKSPAAMAKCPNIPKTKSCLFDN